MLSGRQHPWDFDPRRRLKATRTNSVEENESVTSSDDLDFQSCRLRKERSKRMLDTSSSSCDDSSIGIDFEERQIAQLTLHKSTRNLSKLQVADQPRWASVSKSRLGLTDRLRRENKPSVLSVFQAPQSTAPQSTAPQSTAPQSAVPQSAVPQSLCVSASEVAAIEKLLKGHRTLNVHVCGALANLYKWERLSEWQLMYTGIPTWLFGHDQLQFLLVEKGSCLPLFSHHLVTGLTSYQVVEDLFHVINHDKSGMRLGLSFDCRRSALTFHARLRSLETAMASSSSLSALSSSSSTSSRVACGRRLVSGKAEISLPCSFEHVVSVGERDARRLFSMDTFGTRTSAKTEVRSETSRSKSNAPKSTEESMIQQSRLSVFAGGAGSRSVCDLSS